MEKPIPTLHPITQILYCKIPPITHKALTLDQLTKKPMATLHPIPQILYCKIPPIMHKAFTQSLPEAPKGSQNVPRGF